MKVLADARQVDQHRDADRFQPASWSDAGQQQQLRRVDRTSADDHLAGRHGALGAAVANVLDAGAAAAVEPQPGGLRAVDQLQRLLWRGLRLLPLQRGVEVGRLDAMPLAVLDVDVVPAGSLHLRTVEVVGPGEPEFGARVDEGLRDRVRIVPGDARHPQRTSLAGQRTGIVLLILQLLEVPQHVLEGPIRAAVVGPVVVVAAMSPDVHQGVEVAGSARHPAARLRKPPAEAMRLRHAEVAPVDRRVLDEPPVRGDSDVFRNRRWNLPIACLHHGHVDAGIFTQPRGDDGAGRARSDDDVIVIRHHPALLRDYGLLWSTNGWYGRRSWIVGM